MDIGVQNGLNTGLVVMVAVTAVIFGILYAIFIEYIRRAKRLEGFTALSVVCGVLITLALSAIIIGLRAALLVVFIFACTGTPMIIADIWVYTTERKKKADELRAVLNRNDD
ncbi:MAG TPA: ammonium transporter [Anaerolineae bacterium]|nr:ammonium transporter [Anaerolineae bacterium]